MFTTSIGPPLYVRRVTLADGQQVAATPTRRRRARRASAAGAPVALGWVDAVAVGERTLSPHAGPARGAVPEDRLDTALDSSPNTGPYIPAAAPDLLTKPPHRSPLRPGVLVPIGVLAALAGIYTATTLLWPLYAVAPTVTPAAITPIAAPAASLPWPAEGSAAVRIAGIDGSLASSDAVVPMASVTKVVTALIVLEEMPLALGEQGPEYRFTAADSAAYWNYLRNDESALDVPAGGVLTQYQLLEGMLMGSAGNYADRLAQTIWPTDALFARAANNWLELHGVPGITVVEPTGIDPDNEATAEALLPLAQLALANPVIAEIVAQPVVDLPGAGEVVNTNGLLTDAGMLGIKTGQLREDWNLLSAKEIDVAGTPVRVFASVLTQPDDETRHSVSRGLYAEIERALQPIPAVTSATLAGTVTTVWGESVDIITSDDADLIHWNGSSSTVTATFALDEQRSEGGVIGTVSAVGPFDSATSDLVLAADIEAPTAWWRLTHPLELFGLD